MPEVNRGGGRGGSGLLKKVISIYEIKVESLTNPPKLSMLQTETQY